MRVLLHGTGCFAEAFSESSHDTLLLAQSDELTSASRISVHEKMAATIAREERAQSSEILWRELAFAVYMLWWAHHSDSDLCCLLP
jgi:hypothetical protein